MPALATQAREKQKLWVTDAELIRLMGVPEKMARQTLRMLDNKHSGFPKKSKLWGGRRYLPSVMAYFERYHGGTLLEPQQGEQQ